MTQENGVNDRSLYDQITIKKEKIGSRIVLLITPVFTPSSLTLLQKILVCDFNHILEKNMSYTFYFDSNETVVVGRPTNLSNPRDTFVTTDSGVFWREDATNTQWFVFFTKEKASFKDVPSFVTDLFVMNPENFTARDDIGDLPEISPKNTVTDEAISMVQAITSVAAFAVSEAYRKERLKTMSTPEDLNPETVKGTPVMSEKHVECACLHTDENPVEELDHKHKRYDDQNREPEVESLLDDRPVPVQTGKSAGNSLDNIFTGSLNTEQGIDLIAAECYRNTELRAYLKSRLLATLSMV